jgi:hypothetical protein
MTSAKKSDKAPRGTRGMSFFLRSCPLNKSLPTLLRERDEKEKYFTEKV